MLPLRLIAWGFLVVVVDVRVDSFDMLPDVVGWAIIVLGLTSLVELQVAFLVALVAGVVALVGALVLEYFVGVGAPSLRYAGNTNPWSILDFVASGVFVFSLCTGLRRLALAAGDTAAARSANVVRWLDVLLVFASVSLGRAVSAEPQVVTGWWRLPLLVVLLVALVTAVWLLYLLFSRADAPYLRRDSVHT